MQTKLVRLLIKNKIIKTKNDLVFLKPFNANPFKQEVVKIYSRFKKKSYIIKRCAKKEISNLFLADTLISKNKISNKCLVLKPIDNIDDIYLFEDLGKPLNKKVRHTSADLFDFIVELNDFFINNGYFWRGLALRNLFYKDKKCILIDFENFYPINKTSISQRYIFFLELNLMQNFNKKIVDRYIKQLGKKYNFTNKKRKKDNFERAGFELFSLTDFSEDKSFEILDSSTIGAEKPLRNGKNTPFETGHIIDEVVSNKISLLWTLITQKMRLKNEIIFKVILDDLKKIIKNNNIEYLKFYVAAVIASNGRQTRKFIQKIDQARKNSDYKVYDEIIISIIKTLCNIVGIDYKKIYIIARGSYGECVLTSKSDLDFEVVEIEKDKTSPLLVLEDFVCDILNNLGINAEGTEDRPVEQDLKVNKNTTRDFFEFFELRIVSGSKQTFNKYRKYFLDLIIRKKMWNLQTEYEAKRKKINNKAPFEEIRFVITKLAILYNKKILPSETFEKIKMCPKKYQRKIHELLKEASKLRIEEKNNFKKAEELISKMNKIRIKFNIAQNNYIKDDK